MDSDFGRTMGDNERRGFLSGFDKKNNLEVLEEDKSPSDELDIRRNSKSHEI